MAVHTFPELMEHVGHDVEVVTYGREGHPPVSVAIECEDCGCVLVDFDRSDDDENVSSLVLYDDGEVYVHLVPRLALRPADLLRLALLAVQRLDPHLVGQAVDGDPAVFVPAAENWLKEALEMDGEAILAALEDECHEM